MPNDFVAGWHSMAGDNLNIKSEKEKGLGMMK